MTSRLSRANLLGCLVQLNFEHLQDWRSNSLSGPLTWHLTILRIGTFSIISNQNFPCCNLCLLPLVLSLCISKDSLALPSARPPVKCHSQQQDTPFASSKTPQFFSASPWFINVFLQGKPKTGHVTSSAQVCVGAALGFASAALQ